MKTIFLVCHERIGEDGSQGDIKIIGLYDTKNKADEIVSFLKLKDGFKDYPDGFSVDPYELNAVFWGEGFRDL